VCREIRNGLVRLSEGLLWATLECKIKWVSGRESLLLDDGIRVVGLNWGNMGHWTGSNGAGGTR